MSNDGLIIENMDLSHIHLAVIQPCEPVANVDPNGQEISKAIFLETPLPQNRTKY
jgi:hypothetical protein